MVLINGTYKKQFSGYVKEQA